MADQARYDRRASEDAVIGMRLIICLDDRNGMMFNGRRQSRDRALIEDIEASVGGGTIYTSLYSAPLFEGAGVKAVISEEIPLDAGSLAVYFMEDRSPSPYLASFDGVTVYRWNRHYPADVVFDVDLKTCGFRLVEQIDFAGTSHETITKEIFER